MRFLVDMALSPRLAEWLVRQGHDAVHASSIGLGLAPDQMILAEAAAQHRVVVTADLDFPRLVALAKNDGPGVILFRAGDWSEEAAKLRLATALSVIPENELPNSIVVIERGKIRRRGLPIK
ncbi:MAG TPA: DUF5615 family PIN-like protein [Candidatus Binataceae bacterium]|nr:DUF5615 family PIN-like protein [Candidatus Binataceae bacterium]